jgi:hypothetical protein
LTAQYRRDFGSLGEITLDLSGNQNDIRITRVNPPPKPL